jgi:type IV secretion system protein VirB10
MNNSRFAAGLAAMLVIWAGSFAAEDTITLPAGSELHVQLVTTLSSKTNDAGDFWTGKVVEPIFGKGGEIVPDGSTVDGHITYVKGPGRVKGKGEMVLVADSISTPDASKYNIAANLEGAQGTKVKDEGTGAMTALARRFSRKGKDIVLPPGAEVTFAISRETAAKKVSSRQ